MGLENADLYSVQTIIYHFLYFLKEMLAEYDVPCSNQYNIAVGAVSGYRIHISKKEVEEIRWTRKI